MQIYQYIIEVTTDDLSNKTVSELTQKINDNLQPLTHECQGVVLSICIAENPHNPVNLPNI